MNRWLDRLTLLFFGCCLLFCMAAVGFVGLVCWWLAYYAWVFGASPGFGTFCLIICGTCAYALVQLVMLIGHGLRTRVQLPVAMGGGPGL